jgi:ATP-dependent helicase/nuclease subunit A
VDYKTDKVTDAKELVNRYGIQLDLYSKALEQLTRKKVKEKLIYSFWLQEEIAVTEI